LAPVRPRRHAHSRLAALGLATSALFSVRCSSPTLPSKTIIIPSPAISCPVVPTEGEVPAPGNFAVASAFGLHPQLVEPDQSYPADLTTRLAQRYTAQGASRVDAFTINLSDDSNDDCNPDPPAPTTSGIVVVNAGCLGAKANDTTTLNRLKDKIAVYQPDILLLLVHQHPECLRVAALIDRDDQRSSSSEHHRSERIDTLNLELARCRSA
jgi:hypothetical protein